MSVREPDGYFIDMAVDTAHEESPIQRGVETPFGLLNADQDIIVAGLALALPADVLRTLRARLRSDASQGVIYPLGPNRVGIGKLGYPLPGPIKRTLVISPMLNTDPATWRRDWP